MVETVERADVATLPPAPKNPLPYWRRLKAARAFHTGPETLRDAGGPVSRATLGPKWLVPPVLLSLHRRVRGMFWAAPTRSPNAAPRRLPASFAD